MWNKNIEVFMGCEKEFDEADTVLFGRPLISTTSTVQEQDLEAVQSEENRMGLRHTVHIRMQIWKRRM